MSAFRLPADDRIRSRPARARAALTERIADESGGMTVFGLYVTLIALVIGGLALDVSNAIRMRTMLQMTADSAAHAALLVRETGTVEEAQKQGGTLVIRAAPGRALELQYEASRIISRINSFFGHAAIASIKVMQAHSLPQGPSAPPPLPQKSVCEQDLASLDESPLKTALERLGRGVASARSSPQAK